MYCLLFLRMQKLKLSYELSIVPLCINKFSYLNRYQVPNLYKVVVNRGFDYSCQNSKVLDLLQNELTVITGQKPCIRYSRIAISAFKIRKGSPVGLVVTLRANKMYSFLDRLINLVIPRIRDFQGLSVKGFDSFGNYSFSIVGLEAFPEINLDKKCGKSGIDITLCVQKKGGKCTVGESRFLLSSLGLPFIRL